MVLDTLTVQVEYIGSHGQVVQSDVEVLREVWALVPRDLRDRAAVGEVLDRAEVNEAYDAAWLIASVEIRRRSRG